MKQQFKIFFFYTLFIKIFFINFVYADKINILYKVENFPITNTDIIKEINYLTLLNKDLKNIDEKELIKYASKSVIREKVKKNKLLDIFKFGDSEDIVKKQIDVLIKDLNLNDEEFEQLLKSLGLSINYIKEKIEVEFLWNRLIVTLYKDKLNINVSEIENRLRKDLEDPSNLIDEFLLYEILFSPTEKSNLNNEVEKIYKSISDIGFENTANILSEAPSAKLGGKIGWVSQNQLSKQIYQKIKVLELNKHTEAINVPGGLIILYLKDRKKVAPNFSFEDELKKTISAERNRQLTQYSSVYYKKIEIDTKIYEN